MFTFNLCLHGNIRFCLVQLLLQICNKRLHLLFLESAPKLALIENHLSAGSANVSEKTQNTNSKCGINSLYSIALLRRGFHLLGTEFPWKSIYGSSKNNLSLLNTPLFSYTAKNTSGLIPFYFKACLSRAFWRLTRTASRTDFCSWWTKKSSSLGSFSSWKRKAGHDGASAGHWKVRAADQLPLGKGSSWASTTGPHALTTPSAAAIKTFQCSSTDEVDTGNSAKAVP